MSNLIVDKGLEGIVALSSSISSIVDGILTYRGYDIDDLTENTTFEEVVYLLWHKDLPNRQQLDTLSQALRRERQVPVSVMDPLRQFPKTSTPMESLRTAVSLLSFSDPDSEDISAEANQRKAVRLTAQMPTLIAALERFRKGKPFVAPSPELDTAANFLYMLRGVAAEPIEIEALDKALILHADHELNASTFAARQTVSTLSDMHSALCSAIGTLKGPLHGGANEQVMRTLKKIGDPDRVEKYLNEALDNKERIMGFGHRVYKDGDPRAKHLKRMSLELGQRSGETQWYKISDKLEALMGERKGLKPNVDFYSASVYNSLRIPLDLYTPIFVLSRVSGWIAHILEQYANNRLIRPRAEYTGPTGRRVKPLGER